MNFSEKIVQKKHKQKLNQLTKKQIQKRIRKTKLSKIQDHQSKKKGNVTKTKRITKKTYQTFTEKSKPQIITLPENITLDTFYLTTSNYLNILKRTQNYIHFDSKILMKACQALIAYNSLNNEKIIDIHIYFEKDIICSPRSFQMQQFLNLRKLPFKNISKRAFIVANLKYMQKQDLFKQSKQIDLQIISFKGFIKRLQSKDKHLIKQLKSKETHAFIDFKLFKENIHTVSGIMGDGISLFPISLSKVPYSLSESVHSYRSYLQYLIQSYYFVTKSGSHQLIRFNSINNVQELSINVQQSVHYLVAKLIERNTQKGNKVLRIELKTISSSPIQIYKLENI